jgi:hypothetical protein
LVEPEPGTLPTAITSFYTRYRRLVHPQRTLFSTYLRWLPSPRSRSVVLRTSRRLWTACELAWRAYLVCSPPFGSPPLQRTRRCRRAQAWIRSVSVLTPNELSLESAAAAAPAGPECRAQARSRRSVPLCSLSAIFVAVCLEFNEAGCLMNLEVQYLLGQRPNDQGRPNPSDSAYVRCLFLFFLTSMPYPRRADTLP